jgi:hypothetical protein
MPLNNTEFFRQLKGGYEGTGKLAVGDWTIISTP